MNLRKDTQTSNKTVLFRAKGQIFLLLNLQKWEKVTEVKGWIEIIDNPTKPLIYTINDFNQNCRNQINKFNTTIRIYLPRYCKGVKTKGERAHICKAYQATFFSCEFALFFLFFFFFVCCDFAYFLTK